MFKTNLMTLLESTKMHRDNVSVIDNANNYDTLNYDSDVIVRAGFKKSVRLHGVNYRRQPGLPAERSYTGLEIEKVAKKYNLKMLRTEYYIGVIPKELVNKISEFEKDYETNISSYDCFILAPPSMFNLSKVIRPKDNDPVFFIRNNDTREYDAKREDLFYAIYQWGNDLSIFRRLSGIFTGELVGNLLLAIVGLISCLALFSPEQLFWQIGVPVIGFIMTPTLLNFFSLIFSEGLIFKERESVFSSTK